MCCRRTCHHRVSLIFVVVNAVDNDIELEVEMRVELSGLVLERGEWVPTLCTSRKSVNTHSLADDD